MPAPVKHTLQKKGTPQGGRPCLLTPKRQAILLKAIEDGLPLKQAAMLAGISYDTFNRWRKRGESKYEPLRFREFCNAVTHAEAVAMQRHLNIISDAGKKDWKASAWILQRRFREDFGEHHEPEKIGPEEERRQLFAKVAKLEMHPVQRMIFENKQVRENVFNMVTKLGEILQRKQAEKEEKERREAPALKGARLRE